MLSVVCFKWRQPGYAVEYTAAHVEALRRMVARFYPAPHRFICVTDDPAGLGPGVEVVPLWSLHGDLPNPAGSSRPSCYRRLWLFSREAEAVFGPRFFALDLDVVAVGDLRPLWDRPEDFVGWRDPNFEGAYCGSMFLLRAGARAKVWESFDPLAGPAAARRAGFSGSDQAWLSLVLGRGEASWGPPDGVVSFKQDILRGRRGLLPSDRLVVFHGNPKPWSEQARRMAPWVREAWG